MKQCNHSKMCQVCCRSCEVDAEIKRHTSTVDRAAIWNHRRFGGFKPWSAENVAEFAEEQIAAQSLPAQTVNQEMLAAQAIQNYDVRPFSAMTGAHATHVERWLRSNEKSTSSVKWSLYPIGMVQRWIERADNATAPQGNLRTCAKCGTSWTAPVNTCPECRSAPAEARGRGKFSPLEVMSVLREHFADYRGDLFGLAYDTIKELWEAAQSLPAQTVNQEMLAALKEFMADAYIDGSLCGWCGYRPDKGETSRHNAVCRVARAESAIARAESEPKEPAPRREEGGK